MVMLRPRISSASADEAAAVTSAHRNVRIDFHSQSQFDRRRRLPFHGWIPNICRSVRPIVCPTRIT
jgi:hypothetical protein